MVRAAGIACPNLQADRTLVRAGLDGETFVVSVPPTNQVACKPKIPLECMYTCLFVAVHIFRQAHLSVRSVDQLSSDRRKTAQLSSRPSPLRRIHRGRAASQHLRRSMSVIRPLYLKLHILSCRSKRAKCERRRKVDSRTDESKQLRARPFWARRDARLQPEFIAVAHIDVKAHVLAGWPLYLIPICRELNL